MITKRNFIGLCIGFGLFALSLIFSFLELNPLGGILLFCSILCITIFGLIMLLAESTIVGTVYWKIIISSYLVSNGLSFFSDLFLLDYGQNIILAGMLIYSGTYLLWFVKKRKYGHLDWIKLLWMLSYVVFPINKFYPDLPAYFFVGTSAFLWILILDFLAIAAFGPKPFFLESENSK